MKRPLRSVLVGDCDHYFSPYIFGVKQAMTRLGAWHSQVSIRQPIEVISQRIQDVRPDILWTHMLLWAPSGAPAVEKLVSVAMAARRRGAHVIIHDGDYKDRTRHPHDISAWCTLALCNHAFDRSAWRVRTLKWPYFAFAQDQIAPPAREWQCDLFFAGAMRADATYGARTKLLEEVRRRGVALRVPTSDDGNTLFRTAEIAASATTVLGFGRPGVKGWVDTRVFQYPGAGGVLLHDDVAGYLTPGEHYVPYASGNAGSLAEAVLRVKAMSEGDRMALRQRAFAYVQRAHSSVKRVSDVLDLLYGGGRW